MSHKAMTITRRSRIQLFNNLPEVVRDKAITNYEDQCDGPLKYNEQHSHMKECILNSFDVSASPEGADYWWGVINSFKHTDL